MSRHGSSERLQERRWRAIVLLKEGYTQAEVAQKLGVTQGAVSQWKSAHAKGGNQSLVAKPAPGTLRR